MTRVLIVGSHFDDIEIGMGGTLYKMDKEEFEVYLAVLKADEMRSDIPEVRRVEQYKVLKRLGLSKERLFLFESTEGAEDVIGALDKIKPNILFIPHYKDTNQDHRRCSRIGQSVARKVYINSLFYAGASATSFCPNSFARIDFEAKLDLLKIYKSQIKRDALNIERIKRRDRYFGTMISTDKDCYAEGFIVRKIVIW